MYKRQHRPRPEAPLASPAEEHPHPGTATFADPETRLSLIANRRTGSADFTDTSFSWHHFLDIGVFRDRLVLRAVGQNGRVADEVVLRP